MSLMLQILVRGLILLSSVLLMACGQQGPLYLPQSHGTERTSLPQSLLPGGADDIPVPVPTVVKPSTPAASSSNNH
jgi:predicted small lipoprotein YifL